MNIDIASIKVLSANNEIASFFESLHQCNYVIDHSIITFKFYKGFDFFLNDLSMIIKATDKECTKEARGEIITVSFLDVTSLINYRLSYTSDGGYISTSIDKNLVNSRVEQFWMLIKKYFDLPPSVCYEHKPVYPSYFDFGVMWEFCFILLNEKQQGIIIYAGAAD